MASYILLTTQCPIQPKSTNNTFPNKSSKEADNFSNSYICSLSINYYISFLPIASLFCCETIRYRRSTCRRPTYLSSSIYANCFRTHARFKERKKERSGKTKLCKSKVCDIYYRTTIIYAKIVRIRRACPVRNNVSQTNERNVSFVAATITFSTRHLYHRSVTSTRL